MLGWVKRYIKLRKIAKMRKKNPCYMCRRGYICIGCPVKLRKEAQSR